MENPEVGKVQISEDVIVTIASQAASEIKGVYEMGTNSAGDLFAKKAARGVKINFEENEENAPVVIDLYFTIEYGSKITEVAANVQRRVKEDVEIMTGITVSAVHAHIQGIHMSGASQKE